MSETGEKFGRLRNGYSGLDDADKILFWVKFALAPAIIVASTFAAFGWPALTFWAGLVLWKCALR